MKIFYIDTNFILRFFLKDHKEHFSVAEDTFLQAKNGIISLVCITEVILEVEYVLRKVYKLPRKKIATVLRSLVDKKYIGFPDKKIIHSTLSLYNSISQVDLVDIVLFLKACDSNAEVLSFDKDFKKLKKKSPVS